MASLLSEYGLQTPGPIKYVRLRAVTHGSVVRSETPHHVEWTHRWIVKGHWRKQWFPGHKIHRQMWIYPFVKGPDDKPLIVRRTVNNVAR